MPRVRQINHVAVVVDDMDKALSFWRDALGMELHGLRDVPAEKSQVAFLVLPCIVSLWLVFVWWIDFLIRIVIVQLQGLLIERGLLNHRWHGHRGRNRCHQCLRDRDPCLLQCLNF